MTEPFHTIAESPMPTRWREIQPAKVSELRDVARDMQLTIPDGLPAFRGGGIIEPADGMLSAADKAHVTSSRPSAIMLANRKGRQEPNTVIHFPASKEAKRFDATYHAYQAVFSKYMQERWDVGTFGANPLPGTVASRQLEDGRFVTATRLRKNYEPLGASEPAIGNHVMDTGKLSPDESRHLVRVLDKLHADANQFQDWVKAKGQTIPKESWMHPENPSYALRGKEWWISPNGQPDRMTELTKNAASVKDLYAKIDPDFDVAEGITRMIKNNIDLFPHQNGTVDNPALAADGVVVHGALSPDNIHIQRDTKGRIQFTVTGGDRAQGYGLRGQMVDWLITSAAGSPKHQEAMIEEFMKLHPSDKDKRGLAMHVMYRSVMEAPWYKANGKLTEANNLVQLSYDILKGNGVWRGVDTLHTTAA